MSFLPPDTKDTRSAFEAADNVPVLQAICELHTLRTAVSNAARLAVFTDPGARFVKVKSPSSPAGPVVGREPVLGQLGEPIIATL